MTIRIAAFAALLGLTLAGPALANHCPKDMAEIDKALGANPMLPAATLAEVKSLRAEGEKLHAAGDHTGSMDRLAKAKMLLGIK